MILAGALLIPVALSAAGFEGKVTFQMTSGRGKPADLTYSIKGDKVRMEFPNQKGSGGMIMDTSKREMMVMMDEQKMYMVMALPDTVAEAAAGRAEDVKLEKTSETTKIAGYTATKYIVTSREGTTDLWLAEGLGTFMGMSNNSNPMGGKRAAPKAWERALAGKEMFPLRVVGKDFKMEATSVEKTSLPDSLFTPPAGYQKFDMGGMMKGALKGMFPGSR